MFSIAAKCQAGELRTHPKSLQRLTKLKSVLQGFRTVLRDDSVLAWNYAIGKLPGWRFRDIVFELLLTRYLYEFTDYQRYLREEMEHHHHLPLTTTTMRSWIIPLAKLRTLRKSRLPDIWPWMAILA